MDIVLILLGMVCLLVGLVGCVVPMLPGPPVAYVGLLLLHLTSGTQFTAAQLLWWLFWVAVAQGVDYLLPMLGSKYTGGGRGGSRGCLVGTLIGLFFMPWGLVVGPFVGAFVGTLLEGRSTSEALKSGMGSLLGFLLGTLFKCVLCGYFVWQFMAAILS